MVDMSTLKVQHSRTSKQVFLLLTTMELVSWIAMAVNSRIQDAASMLLIWMTITVNIVLSEVPMIAEFKFKIANSLKIQV